MGFGAAREVAKKGGGEGRERAGEVGKDGERVREGRGREEELEEEGMVGKVGGAEDMGVDLFEVGEGVGRREGFEKGCAGWDG
ncbi:hypothetical protein V6N12_004994 [Hibiscus sabdariffa]|uniref:Uncharacterized protein n=1 Tax=Hibiscus sabdariffa TaxID=183260 RepID=A0ABR2CN60_9ROSI